MKNLPLPRLDQRPDLANYLRRYCRFEPGQIWCDEVGPHKIACLPAEDTDR